MIGYHSPLVAIQLGTHKKVTGTYKIQESDYLFHEAVVVCAICKVFTFCLYCI